MNRLVNPEFFKAFDHYKAMLEQYGEDHPITEQAFLLTLHYTPDHIKNEMHKKAKELNLLPPVIELYKRGMILKIPKLSNRTYLTILKQYCRRVLNLI